MEPVLEKTVMGSNTSREHVSLWGCSEGVPGGEEGEARPGRLLAGMVTHEGTGTHSRAHSASAFASTGDVPPTPLLRRLRKISRPDVPAAGYTALLE